MRHIKVFFQNLKLGYLWTSVILKAPPFLSIDGCLKVITNNYLDSLTVWQLKSNVPKNEKEKSIQDKQLPNNILDFIYQEWLSD